MDRRYMIVRVWRPIKYPVGSMSSAHPIDPTTSIVEGCFEIIDDGYHDPNSAQEALDRNDIVKSSNCKIIEYWD